VHNPVDLQRFNPATIDRRSARARLGVPESAPLLAVIAQITPWKGQATAVRTLAQIRVRRPDAQLLLVGESKFVHKATRYDNRGYERFLRALAASLEVSDAVAFLGEREDVPEILAALDMLLVPSWEEPFGRSVIEGMAMGIPVLATNVGGPIEIIADGREGRLLSPEREDVWADVVAELLDDPVQRRAMAHCARLSARRFDRTRHAATVVEVYREVLSRPHRPRLRHPRRARRRRARASSRVARRLGAS
jgi:glycosyltransferase involved in cell wall biosynthesis